MSIPRAVCGTPGFIPPEALQSLLDADRRAKGEKLPNFPCKAADVWSLGATLYYMITLETLAPVQQCKSISASSLTAERQKYIALCSSTKVRNRV